MADFPMTGIDHPIIAVRDMTAGRAAYGRLGFTVTPRGHHLEWGTGNWCIMFERDYIELRGIIDPKNTHNLGHVLENREGLMGIAFATDDAEATYEDATRRGLHAQPVRRLTRDFELPEGTVQPKFSLCFLDPADTPGLMSVVFCQHLTPELLRRPAWLRHANGARGVRSMRGLVPDIAAAADHYAQLFGLQAIVRESDGFKILVNAGQTISLMTPDAARVGWPDVELPTCGESGCIFSVALEVEDSRQTEQYFATNDIESCRSAAGAIRIAPRYSCGVPLEFIDRA